MHNKVGWIVGDKFFNNKIKALEQNNWKNEGIKFYYKNSELSKYDFSKEPQQDWHILLRNSCLKLREQGNYVALWLSGGGDSATILRAFADNNIPLDEIVFYDRLYKIYDYWKIESAYTKKLINNYKNINPQCNIRILKIDYDNAQDFYKKFKNDWIYQPHVNIRFSKNLRWHFIERDKNLRQSINSKKRIDIFGRDKPKLISWDNKWWLTFFDSFEYDTYHAGFYHFYWDDLDILCKQAHMAARFFESQSNNPEEFCHKVQNNTPGPLYLEYSKAIGRYSPGDKFIAEGWEKGTQNPASLNYESANILKYSKQNDEQTYQYYTDGFDYIKSKFDMGNQQEFIGNILGEKYFLRNISV
jgi:hypothetical protein